MDENIVKELIKIVKQKDIQPEVKIKSLDVLQHILLKEGPKQKTQPKPLHKQSESKPKEKPNLMQELSERIKHRKIEN